MLSAPEYIMGTQGFAGAWTDSNVSELVVRLDEAEIKHYDTAQLYPITNPGGSERLLRSIKRPDFVIDTKILFRPEALSKQKIDESIRSSLENLGLTKVNTLYAHAPDKLTSIADQALNFNQLHKAGYFDKLGLCNYSPAQLTEWIEIATEKNYIQPSVYQGQYNIFCRQYEKELFPLLRKHGITFIANSPLAGGFATGKLTFAKDAEQLKGTRFEQSDGNMMGYLYRMWYDKPVFNDAVQQLVTAVDGDRDGLAQVSMRWLLFHSGLKSSDKVAIGPTKVSQLEDYLTARQVGPLPKDLAATIDLLYEPMREEAAPLVEVGWWSM
ncbi:Aldo/keto reductase [Penicillium verhagenii]|uniref:Aldo/keto reductase n=1 Tax=Penicillium verhagenii TaxID=1562060 RepID=UPI002544E4A0|nr:Aldo/keto reductase [Penicillium verhagenii]KAJ5937088.1 Aldo/keto reductase [Penicillium verhagenii]